MLKPSRAKRLSELLPEALGPAAAKQGFAGAEILARWAEIAGPDLAGVSAPQKLSAPPRAPAADPDAPAPRSVLTIRVEGAFALEAQHRTAEIVERVNAHLGWPCIGAVKIRQGQVAALRRSAARPAPLPPATEDERKRVGEATAAIQHEGLAEALDRLGQAALARARPGSRR